MNHELKFRVWDTLSKQFYDEKSLFQGHYTISLKGKFHNLQNGSGGDEYIIQQYTGLQDANGHDIYEGDILKGDFRVFDVEKEEMISLGQRVGHVWFVDCLASYKLSFDGLYSPQCYDLSDLWYPEIVGNICQNPELIESQSFAISE